MRSGALIGQMIAPAASTSRPFHVKRRCRGNGKRRDTQYTGFGDGGQMVRTDAADRD